MELVPLELRHEDKVIGGRLSVRQLTYLLAGLVIGLCAAGGAGFLLRAVPAVAVFAGVLFLAPPLAVAAALAFLPAGCFRWLPGPQEAGSDNPFEPPIRLDEWLILLWRRRRMRLHLPWGEA